MDKRTNNNLNIITAEYKKYKNEKEIDFIVNLRKSGKQPPLYIWQLEFLDKALTKHKNNKNNTLNMVQKS